MIGVGNAVGVTVGGNHTIVAVRVAGGGDWVSVGIRVEVGTAVHAQTIIINKIL
jgi:hypothetical protein